MPDHHLHLSKPSLAFAKLVATPNETSWSQAYNAGNLFVCLSLSREGISEEDSSLHLLGKTLFSNLEAEFFSLTEKNLESIKQAIELCIKDAPQSISVNLVMAFFKDSVLYLFIAGKGKVVMRRNGTNGALLDKKDEDGIISASGFLKNEDMLILETRPFADDISDENLYKALELDLPNDIAEILSPLVLEKDDGGQAGIIIVYHGLSNDLLEEEELLDETPENEPEEEKEEVLPGMPEEEIVKKKISLRSFKIGRPDFHAPGFSLVLNHRKKLFLSLAVILMGLLIFSIFSTKKKQEEAKVQALFVSVYTPAQKNFEEGKSIESLNKSLSRDDFLKAEKTINDNLSKFKKGTDQEKRLSALLTQVKAELSTTTDSKSVTAREADISGNDLLELERSTQEGLAFGQDADNLYYVTSKAIVSVNKNSGKKIDLIKNDSDWISPTAIFPYQGNIYLLDTKNGILKFMAASDGFSKANYFKAKPDLSGAVSMAIDGSVYILFKDGSVLKYTRGEADAFKIKGLPSPLSAPSEIFTDINSSGIYILDKGNSRIAKLASDGSFESQYSASVIKDAKDFEVLEAEKKFLILSGGKIWEIKF